MNLDDLNLTQAIVKDRVVKGSYSVFILDKNQNTCLFLVIPNPQIRGGNVIASLKVRAMGYQPVPMAGFINDRRGHSDPRADGHRCLDVLLSRAQVLCFSYLRRQH